MFSPDIRKYGPRKTAYLGSFHRVHLPMIACKFLRTQLKTHCLKYTKIRNCIWSVISIYGQKTWRYMFFSIIEKPVSWFAIHLTGFYMIKKAISPRLLSICRNNWPDVIQAGIYVFKVNNRNTKQCVKSTIYDVILVSLLLTLKRLQTLFWFLQCLSWTAKYRLWLFLYSTYTEKYTNQIKLYYLGISYNAFSCRNVLLCTFRLIQHG